MTQIYQMKNKPLVEMKNILNDKSEMDQEINIMELVQEVLKDDYQAESEAIEILNDLGINENDTIRYIAQNISKCRIKVSDSITVQTTAEEFMNDENIEIKRDNDKTSLIIHLDDYPIIE